MTWKLHEIQMSVSINRVLLECSNSLLLRYYLWLLPATLAEFQWRLDSSQCLKYLLFGPFLKRFANSDLVERSSVCFSAQPRWHSSLKSLLWRHVKFSKERICMWNFPRKGCSDLKYTLLSLTGTKKTLNVYPSKNYPICGSKDSFLQE